MSRRATKEKRISIKTTFTNFKYSDQKFEFHFSNYNIRVPIT